MAIRPVLGVAQWAGILERAYMDVLERFPVKRKPDLLPPLYLRMRDYWPGAVIRVTSDEMKALCAPVQSIRDTWRD